jgi:excinuclease ABC subunit B
VEKSIEHVRFVTRVADAREDRDEEHQQESGRGRRGGKKQVAKVAEKGPTYDLSDPAKLITQLEAEMKEAAKALDFEQAARLRDQLFEVKARVGGSSGSGRGNGAASAGGGLAALRAER